MKILLFLFCTLVVSLYSNASTDEFSDGNALLAYCKGVVTPSSDPIVEANALSCLSYIEGINDMHSLLEMSGKPTIWCVPEKTTNNQIVHVVYKYLQDNREVLGQYKSILVVTALKSGFSCQK